MAMSRAEQMLYCATKITTYSDGKPVQTGTGFFYVVHLAAEDKSRDLHIFVTNKHVLQGADRVSISFHQGNGGSLHPGEFTPLFLDLKPEALVNHPDPDVDLCAFPLGQAIAIMAALGRPLFWVSLDKNAIPSDEQWGTLDAIEKITMVGCPNGLFDEANNMPIARSGTTATDIAKRYQGRSEFLIDLACFPGSSGSPVFVYDTNGGFDRGSSEFTVGRVKLYFVGVLYAGPVITNTGEIQLAKGPTFAFGSMMHLGQVIRATEVLAFDQWAHDADSKGLIGSTSHSNVRVD
ncbi:MAG: serine protease [Mesorhizobium sp.]|uniref:S1 family peptidase n=1 Tax=Mesorhizobium sp. TaxID=1871066 RepID=UPI000FE990FE|nr:serine protease [Mesorhizobium sp.]RWN30111.1 MAG: serine protease [Mesorhizobium sp.]